MKVRKFRNLWGCNVSQSRGAEPKAILDLLLRGGSLRVRIPECPVSRSLNCPSHSYSYYSPGLSAQVRQELRCLPMHQGSLCLRELSGRSVGRDGEGSRLRKARPRVVYLDPRRSEDFKFNIIISLNIQPRIVTICSNLNSHFSFLSSICWCKLWSISHLIFI